MGGGGLWLWFLVEGIGQALGGFFECVGERWFACFESTMR